MSDKAPVRSKTSELSNNELYYLMRALDIELKEFNDRGVESCYTKELLRLRRKLKRNHKRVYSFKVGEKA